MTIEGNGNVASVLRHEPGWYADTLAKEPGITYFAAGVSNSQETDESEYQREKDRLMKMDRGNRLVYFGSLAVFYSDTRYTKHKLEMEQLVKDNFPKYCIVRIGNIEWDKNQHTLVNALKARVANGESIQIQDTYRYMVNEEEFLHWIHKIPNFNCEINIPGRRMKVSEIVKEYVLK